MLSPWWSLLLVLVLASLARLGWGPGHHLEFAVRVLRRRKELLPAATARLIGEERDAYLYGNLAADLITVKAWGGHQNHCHRWTIIEEMRERSSSTDGEQAFILGYLSHLAADTIAHNHFVPYHVVRFARSHGLGHLYWEMMADRFVNDARWSSVTRFKALPSLDALDALINASVPRKALSMGTNKLIFNHVLLVSERRAWRRGVERLHPVKKVRLNRGFLRTFQRAAVERIRLALRPRGLATLKHLDTTGKEALRTAARLRRKLVRSIPAGEQRDERGKELALPFLEGMSSPPPQHRQRLPHW